MHGVMEEVGFEGDLAEFFDFMNNGDQKKILDGFRWLGIDWDEGPGVGGPYGPYFQSERLAIYQRAVERVSADIVHVVTSGDVVVAVNVDFQLTSGGGGGDGGVV